MGILQPYADRPGAALSTLKMLRVLIRHAIDIGWLKHDPSMGIKRPKTREIRSWTDLEIQTFEERWPIGTKQRLAFALMLYTGQRRSDVHRMTWSDVTGTSIRVVQQKTGRKLALPLHRELLAIWQRRTAITRRSSTLSVGSPSRWMVSASGCAMRSPTLACRSIVSRTGCAKQLEGVSPRQVVRRMRSWPCWDTRHLLKRSGTRAKQIKGGSQSRRSQSCRDTARTNCPNHFARFGKDVENRRRIRVNKKALALPRGLEPLFSP